MNPKCLFLIASLFIFSAGASADTVGQDGILRDAHGKSLEMTRAKALKACAKHGMHLATIRELVKLRQSEGITLKEPTEVKQGEIRTGAMKPVLAVNPNGKTDEFYYDNDNYTRHGDDLGSHWFWSSSAVSDKTDMGYLLYGVSGEVSSGDYRDLGYTFISAAVFCVVGQ